MWQCNSICQHPLSTRRLGLRNELIWILLCGGGHPLSQAASLPHARRLPPLFLVKLERPECYSWHLRKINRAMTSRSVPADRYTMTCLVWQRESSNLEGRTETAFGRQDMSIEKISFFFKKIHSPWHQSIVLGIQMLKCLSHFHTGNV